MNALLNNPKSRCKLEATLPASYPHVLSATFEGGFLDCATIDFSQNLNCLIGGRGSGKSTALLAIRAALGAELPDDQDPDDPARMPDRTVVRFIDSAGTEREATRERGRAWHYADGSPVELTLADLGQGESGQVASDYRTQRLQMLAYPDAFRDLDKELDAERDVLERLTDNAAEVVRSAFRMQDIKQTDEERVKLDANIKAVEKGKLEESPRGPGGSRARRRSSRNFEPTSSASRLREPLRSCLPSRRWRLRHRRISVSSPSQTFADPWTRPSPN